TYLPHKVRKFCRRFTNHAPLHYAIRMSNALANAETHTFPIRDGEVVTGFGRLQWAVVLGVFLMIIGSGVSAGVRWWLEETRKDPPPVTIVENGLGADREEFYSLAEGSEMFPLAIAQSIRLRPE